MGNLRRLSLRVCVALAVGASVLAWPGSAYAATTTLDVSGSYIFYTAATGQWDHLVIMTGTQPNTYVFDDVAGLLITSTDPACGYPAPGDPTLMQCTATGIQTIVVSVFDGDDAVLNWTDRNTYLYGGDGNDSLWLGGHLGGASYGSGGAGNDYIVSGPGNDVMDGGSGSDYAAYTESVEPVQASLVTNTGGRSYDSDTYYSTENLAGGGGDDSLSGNDSANTILGGYRKTLCGVPRGGGCIYLSGNDTIAAAGGVDVVAGEGGNDFLMGGAGNDEVWGDDGDDWLFGEAGDDHLYGGPGTNHNSGGPGIDYCWNGIATQCEN